MRSCHRDAKWIARWFKQVNNCASKSKLQTGTVGRHLSRSQTAPAMAATPPPTQSIDGSYPVKSPSENLAEPTTSGTGTSESPTSVFSAPLEHTYLFSRSGVQVAPENGRSATGHSPYPYHSRLHSSGWELGHPAVAPDLQGNREHERPLFYTHSHGANPVALPRPHTDLLDSQLPLGIVTNGPVYLASQALSPFRHGTSSPNTGTRIDNVKSRNPHTSPPGALQTPTRYVHLNLASEHSDPAAYMELGLGYPQPDLGPGPGAGVRARVETPGTGTHVDLSHSQVQAVPDFVVRTGSQFRPSESSAPPPSMYWLLFDTELDSVVDQERDDVVTRSSSDRMMEPHVTPTPISFFAKWEDMLALERRIRSSSHNAKMVQSKRIQAVHAVEPSRTRQQSGTGKRGLFRCPLPFSFSFFMQRADAWSKQTASIVVQVAIAEWMSSASARSVLCWTFRRNRVRRTLLFRIRSGYTLASSELD
jgi:hypothetical protein